MEIASVHIVSRVQRALSQLRLRHEVLRDGNSPAEGDIRAGGTEAEDQEQALRREINTPRDLLLMKRRTNMRKPGAARLQRPLALRRGTNLR